ncbi:ISXO2-like transposase domain-containing protein, partial [Nitrosomonas sp. Nm51]|uniref:transposase n=1 Tax=Nitrosomonas sp. Nm51 TaxID=133720 RepID=UPI0008D6979B
HLSPDQCVRSDALSSLAEIGKTQNHTARVTPPDKAGEWLPWVHIAIGNLKTFLLGTYHGVSSGYLQEYLNAFCYRFNRRAWEAELPSRLLCFFGLAKFFNSYPVVRPTYKLRKGG